MAIQLILNVIAMDGDIGPTERLVMITLANFADDKGECWPSISTMMKATGLSRNGLKKVLVRLENDGWLKKANRKKDTTRNLSNRYKINTKKVGHPVTQGVGHSVTDGGSLSDLGGGSPSDLGVGHSVTGGGSLSGRNNIPYILNQSLNQSNRTNKPQINTFDETLFEKFWTAYPHKRDKKAAIKAWTKLSVDDDLAKSIMDGLASEIRHRENVTKGFIPEWKYPATWLNGACWENDFGDEVAQARADKLQRIKDEQFKLTGVRL